MTLVTFLQETKAEMGHVTWPKRKQVIIFTIIVVIVSVFCAYALGALDSIFNKALVQLLRR